MSIFTEGTARSRIIVGVSIFLILALIGGIVYFVWYRVGARFTPIGEILQNVNKFDRQEVTIRGTTRRAISVPPLSASFVLVEDKTGQIWCRLRRTDAQEGEVVTVQGTVYKLVQIPGLGVNVTAIAEESP